MTALTYVLESSLPDPLEQTGRQVIEFGVDWCPHCQLAAPLVDTFIAETGIPLLRIEDGRGRALGRQFSVKQWPTLILLQDGIEIARSVRPSSLEAVRKLFAQLA